MPPEGTSAPVTSPSPAPAPLPHAEPQRERQPVHTPTGGQPAQTPQQAPAAHPQGAPVQQQTPQYTIPQDADWAPEKFRGQSPEALAKSYRELEQQYGQYGGSQGLESLRQWAQYGYQMSQQAQQGQQQPQQAPQQAQQYQGAQQGINWDQWAELNPGQQQQAMYNLLASQAGIYINNALAQKEAYYQQQMREYQEGLQRQQQLYRLALEQKMANPGLDMNQLLQTAAQQYMADPTTLMQNAAYQMTLPQKLQQEVQRQVEAAKAQLKLEHDNQQQQTVTDFSRSTYQAPQLPPKGKAREFIAQKLVADGHVRPDQF